MARSTFASQNVQNKPGSDHFWKLRCRKSAHRCGTKHISKSKCTKHTILGPLLEVDMSKKCTPLWPEAHLQVKMYKTHQVWTTFGRSDVLSRGRRKGLCTLSKASKTTTPHYTPIHYTTTTTTPALHSTTLHLTTLHSTTLHSTTLHYTQLHSITLNYIQLHSIRLNYTQLHSIALNYTQLHSITFNYTQLNSIRLN